MTAIFSKLAEDKKPKETMIDIAMLEAIAEEKLKSIMAEDETAETPISIPKKEAPCEIKEKEEKTNIVSLARNSLSDHDRQIWLLLF